MPRVIHFDLKAQEPERAIRFYSDVFGWSANKWDGPMDYWLISTGDESAPGINGGLSRSQDAIVPDRTINTIDVPNVDEYVAKITDHGGKVIMPKMPIPGVGYMAHCQDTEGNTFGIIQMDPSAQA